MRGLRPTRRGWAVLLLAAAALGFASGPLFWDGSGYSSTPACEYEDSAGPCAWDADLQGNGQGRSFWIDADQIVHHEEAP
jgi:hypothetical protein